MRGSAQRLAPCLAPLQRLPLLPMSARVRKTWMQSKSPARCLAADVAKSRYTPGPPLETRPAPTSATRTV